MFRIFFIVFFAIATLIAVVGTVATFRSDANISADILAIAVTVFLAVCTVVVWREPKRKP